MGQPCKGVKKGNLIKRAVMYEMKKRGWSWSEISDFWGKDKASILKMVKREAVARELVDRKYTLDSGC